MSATRKLRSEIRRPQNRAACSTLTRNQALAARFMLLHHHKRLRLDDVYHQLATEFFLKRDTVIRILRKSVPQYPRHLK